MVETNKRKQTKIEKYEKTEYEQGLSKIKHNVNYTGSKEKRHLVLSSNFGDNKDIWRFRVLNLDGVLFWLTM